MPVDLSKLSDEDLGIYEDLVRQRTGAVPGAGVVPSGQKTASGADIYNPTSAVPPPIAKPPNIMSGEQGIVGAPVTPGQNSFMTSPHGFIRSGARQAVRGLESIAGAGAPENPHPRPHPVESGLSDVLRGTGTAMLPAAIPAAAAAPIAAGGAALGGLAGGMAGQKLTELAGGGPEAQELGADIGAIPGGIIGGRAAGVVGNMARPIMRSAMRLPSNDSAEAVLNETSAVRPGEIARQAGARIGDLVKERDDILSRATEKPQLAPARAALQASAQDRIAGNKVPTEMHPMINRLTVPAKDPVTGLEFQGATEYPTGANTPISISPTTLSILGPSGEPLPGTPKVSYGTTPDEVIANKQNPLDFIGIRKNFGRDFTKFDSAQPLTKSQLKAGNNAYMALTNEAHRVAPGSVSRDDLIHNLIPAKQQGAILSRQPGPIDRGIGRLTARTGAMTLPLVGLATGGPAGAATAITAQEMMSDPAVRAALARGVRRLGRPLSALPSAALSENTQ